MRILIDDFIQYSDADEELMSPSLADRANSNSFSIALGSSRTIDCVGIGNTDATTVTVNGDALTFVDNGLYRLTSSITTSTLTVTTDGTYIGRLAAGVCRKIGLSPSREPGFYSTAAPRITMSGQVVAGAGGIVGRTLSCEARYKIDETIFDDFEAAFDTQTGKGFPFFLLFDDESSRFPWLRLYASIENQEMIFQSSVRRFLYSRQWNFTERF